MADFISGDELNQTLVVVWYGHLANSSKHDVVLDSGPLAAWYDKT